MAAQSNRDAQRIIYSASPKFASLASAEDPAAAKCRHSPRKSVRCKRKSPTRASKLDPLSSTCPAQQCKLTSAMRLKWMEEAKASCLASTKCLELSSRSSSSTFQRSPEKAVTMISHPVVALQAELAMTNLMNEAVGSNGFGRLGNQTPSAAHHSPSSSPSKKFPPISGASTCQPLYSRPKQRQEVLKYKVRVPSRVPIEPILSDEMRAKLRTHLEEKIKGDIWQNEVRSRLARPLSATTFCDREEQLRHQLSAPRFVSPLTASQEQDGTSSQPALYPFSAEAHAWTRQIAKCYTTMCFRVDILAQVRRLAIAIRVFRRRVIPRFVKWHRERKAAALVIQRRFRKHTSWRKDILVPLIKSVVPDWIALGLRRAQAKLTVVRNLEKLYTARKKRLREAIHRHWVCVRWVAKTKVCLFVHLVWCVAWFRKKRESNLRVMEREVQAMEQIDAQKLAEFQILFKTSMGEKLAKRELTLWRAKVRLASTAVRRTSAVRKQDDVDLAGVSTTTAGATSDDPQSGFNASLVRLRNCFAAFDMDSSGTLDLDEFQLMISYLRVKDTTIARDKQGGASTKMSKHAKLTTAQIRGLFEDLDEDGNGRVTCEEFEKWWQKQHEQGSQSPSTSASSSFLSGGLNKLVLESHGLLFWLLGKKQQLERKFVKKLMVKTASDAAKSEFLHTQMRLETSPPVRRCEQCGRRFELQRDLIEHTGRAIGGCSASQLVVDTFVLKKWIREEEIRLLDDEKSDGDDQE